MRKAVCYLMGMVISLFLFSCNKSLDDDTPGLTTDEISKDSLLGGWGVTYFKSYIVPKSNIPESTAKLLRNNMTKNLEKRTKNGRLYFRNDSVYYIEEPEPEVQYIKARSKYTIDNHIIRLENPYLVCDSYAEYFYVKFEDNQLCFYLLKEEVLDLLRHDSSISGFLSIITSNVEDAQFEFYFDRNHLWLYDTIDVLFP